MKIGILEAETLPAKVADRFGSYGEMFVRLLSPINSDFSFHFYAAEQGQLPESTDECDAYIVTGSRHNAYDRDPWIETLKDFIRQLDAEKRKCLGICFGHQVIAQALGGRVEKSEKGWGVGVSSFDICVQPEWLPESPSSFNIRVSHQDQVIELPPQAQRFASSTFCPNAGYFIENHVFCLQGHPEFNSDYVNYLLDKREERIGALRVTEARDSLQLPMDVELFRGWLRYFLFRR